MLILPILKKTPKKVAPLLSLFIIGGLYGYIMKPSLPSEESTKGRVYFVPIEIKEHRSHFKKTEFLKGTIRSMGTSSGEDIKNIPCSIPISSAIKRPNISSSFYITGSLEKKDEFFSFIPDLAYSWIPIPYTFSLADVRFKAKVLLSKKVRSFFSDSNVSDLMSALTIGTLDNRMLKFDFSKLGLQHILSISGFHFGLLAFFLSFFIKFLFKERTCNLILLLFLSAYFLLLGNSPSILRAYLALSFYIISKLGKWRANPINILGVVLFLEVLIDPYVIAHLGFQLSFLATFSILFLLPITKDWALLLFPYRTEAQALKLNPLDKWTYLLCCFLRSSFALNIAVFLTTIPLCLFYFHKFPLISLAYNLFIPLCFSLSLFLFFVSIPLLLIFPPLGSLINFCNEVFTAKVLSLISQSPLCFDIYLRTPTFPLSLLLISLLIVFTLPFFLKNPGNHIKISIR